MRYEIMTINASKFFNGALKRARGLLIQAIITANYYNSIKIFLKRFELALKLHEPNVPNLTQRVHRILAWYECEVRNYP